VQQSPIWSAQAPVRAFGRSTSVCAPGRQAAISRLEAQADAASGRSPVEFGGGVWQLPAARSRSLRLRRRRRSEDAMSLKVTIIGTGYVGLVTGACLAEIGHDVICVETDRRKIDVLLEGKIPIYEPGLDQIVMRNVALGRLRFSTDGAADVKGRDAVFLAVGTPSEKATGRADLRYVFAAAAEVARNIDRFTVLVTKSTVPVGTNRRIAAAVRDHVSGGARIAVASNPEFLREGAAVADFMEPDRVVVGSDDPDAVEVMRRLYAPLGATFLKTALETAELIKYAANGFLAVKVSFINEVADLCEQVGADVGEVAHGIGLDKRIGAAFLRPGPGWGGSCLPKDTRAFRMAAQDAGVPVRIIEAAIESNETRKSGMARRIIRACGGSVAGKKVAVLGLTFKGQTDDMRESPSLAILPVLVDQGARVVAYDPSNPATAAELLPEVEMAASAREAAEGADILVVMTDWKIFAALDLSAIAAVMKRRIMFDFRNMFEPADVIAAGFAQYIPVGGAPLAAGRRREGADLDVIRGGPDGARAAG
jgi:UDPglucose 6-dehydrogenase